MISSFIYSALFLLTGFFQVEACAATPAISNYRSVRGVVTTFDAQPVEDALLFIDYKQTSIRTDKRGKFNLKFNNRIKLITVYHPEYGVISWQHNGQRKLKFIYPQGSVALSIEEMEKMGFTFQPENEENWKWYANFDSVEEILSSRRISNVRVVNGRIIVGKGPHAFNATQDPLIVVNDSPWSIQSAFSIPTTDIASIESIYKGSELASYGLRGANGVIKITLKNSK